MKKIAIIGYGYVGKAYANFFKDRFDVSVYDPYIDWDLVNFPDDGIVKNISKEDVNTCDMAVVCCPTPKGENGECDLTAVEEVLEWIETPSILLKSTVEVGTTDRLKEKYNKPIVFSPEYIGESTYWTEYKFHQQVIETPWFTFGGDKKDTTKMVDFFLEVCGPTKRYIQCEAKEAEMAKYVENTFYYTKVMFFYEIAEICKKDNIDWNTVREIFLADPRINPMHTAVFNNNSKTFNGKVVGGKCYYKDLLALIDHSNKIGYEPKLLQEVHDSNHRIGEINK
jgi:nucleotide sugar dehydrogenase